MNGQWQFIVDGGKLGFYTEGGGNGTGGFIHGNTTVADGSWHHVGVVQNGNSYTFYVDGTADGTVTAGTPVSYDVRLAGAIGYDRFSNYPTFGTAPFTGDIDEVGVWNTSLSAANFATLYNSGAGDQYPF
jgi:Concanavalin A-like lectin/glucanases superfamily